MGSNFLRLHTFVASLTWFGFIYLLTFTSLFGYQEKWNDPKFDSSNSSDETQSQLFKNSEFKISGDIWAAYEHSDSNPKTDDNSTGRFTGFRMGRTYFTAEGKVIDGQHKGWAFRLTLDSEPTGSRNTFLKFAYIDTPALNGLWFRLGQQPTPTANSQSGRSHGSFWQHRYLDEDGRASWDEFKLTPSTDLGLSILYSKPLFNFHLLLANGEGNKKSNGQVIQNKTKEEIGLGEGDSYGIDLHGNFSITPLKTSGPFILNVSFPFRFHNITGIQRNEYENITSLNLATQDFTNIKGERRAKQNISYGTEIDAEYKIGNFEIAGGIGTAIHIDKRTNVYSIDSKVAGLDLNQPADISTFLTNNYYMAEDSKGVVRYIFGHFKYRFVGLVGRYSIGTGSGGVNSTVGVNNGIGSNRLHLYQDLQDDGLLNGSLSLNSLRSLDRGKAKFQKTLIALEFYVNQRFRFAIGVSQITATATNGESIKVNPLYQLPIEKKDSSGTYQSGYTVDYFAQQVMQPVSSAQMAQSVHDNDLWGKRDRNRQFFIRSQFLF
ncbi:MAG: hypothetical protein H3C43_08870 [Leptonema sp. (in: Bacteria)]|nr:hypothetical protein [Leptonema sp. (in: bacteria)]